MQRPFLASWLPKEAPPISSRTSFETRACLKAGMITTERLMQSWSVPLRGVFFEPAKLSSIVPTHGCCCPHIPGRESRITADQLSCCQHHQAKMRPRRVLCVSRPGSEKSELPVGENNRTLFHITGILGRGCRQRRKPFSNYSRPQRVTTVRLAMAPRSSIPWECRSKL